jgi:hypothetical protein
MVQKTSDISQYGAGWARIATLLLFRCRLAPSPLIEGIDSDTASDQGIAVIREPMHKGKTSFDVGS